jgi:hypothetical protein
MVAGLIQAGAGPISFPHAHRYLLRHILALRWTESMLPRLLLLGEGILAPLCSLWRIRCAPRWECLR